MDRRIVVRHASSSEESILFYLNEDPNCYYEGKIIDGKIQIEYIVSEDGDVTSNERQHFYEILLKVLILVQVLCIFLLVLRLMLLLPFETSINLLILAFSFSKVVVYVEDLCLTLIYYCRRINNSLKSKHTAEHKVVNILEKLQRLPCNVEEIKKMTRYNNNCGDELEKKEYLKYAKKILFNILVVFACVVTYKKHYILQIVLVVIIFYIYELLLPKFTLLISKLFQFVTTLKEPEENDLILAWAVAEEWMKHEYPEFNSTN